jgi:formamidopyrimidine-DNA glycosylase
VELDTGEPLLVHLGMSGRMLVGGRVLGEYVHDTGAEDSPHDHVVLHMEDGPRVTFNDARRFGVMDLRPSADIANHRLLRALGPEPLGNAFGADLLARGLSRQGAPVKAALLDQGVVAGLGNIYVSEALARAGSPSQARRGPDRARPDRSAGAGDPGRAARGDRGRGLDLARPPAGGRGSSGIPAPLPRAYDREGQPCLTDSCGGTVRGSSKAGGPPITARIASASAVAAPGLPSRDAASDSNPLPRDDPHTWPTRPSPRSAPASPGALRRQQDAPLAHPHLPAQGRGGDRLRRQRGRPGGLRAAQPELMRGVSKGVVKKNTAARKMSRLAARVKATAAAPSATA